MTLVLKDEVTKIEGDYCPNTNSGILENLSAMTSHHLGTEQDK